MEMFSNTTRLLNFQSIMLFLVFMEKDKYLKYSGVCFYQGKTTLKVRGQFDV